MMHHIPVPETAVEVADLTVSGQAGFSLRVPHIQFTSGSMIALVGRNGSGKSTFLDSLLNLIQADGGTVRIFGEDMSKLRPDHPVRSRIGAQVQGINWSWSIKVGEIFAIHSALYGQVDKDVLRALGIGKLLPLMYRKLSTGQRRRVDLGVALAHRPDLLILDEPSSGLDRQFEMGFRDILAQQISRGATLILATHDGADVGTADRILWFENGQIIEDSDPATVLEREVGRFVGIVECDEGPEAQAIEQALSGKFRFTNRAGTSLRFFGDDDLRAPFVDAMEQHHIAGYSVRPTQSSDLLDAISSRAEEGAKP